MKRYNLKSNCDFVKIDYIKQEVHAIQISIEEHMNLHPNMNYINQYNLYKNLRNEKNNRI